MRERKQMLELVRMFEAHADMPASSDQFGELGVMDLTQIARACRMMVTVEMAEEEALRKRMPQFTGGSSAVFERLAAYFQRKADGA